MTTTRYVILASLLAVAWAAYSLPLQQCTNVTTGQYVDRRDVCGDGTEDCCPADLSAVAPDSDPAETTVDFTFTTDKGQDRDGNTTAYACAYTGATPPTEAEVIAGTGPCAGTDTVTVSSSGSGKSGTITGLSAGTAYTGIAVVHVWDDRVTNEVALSTTGFSTDPGGGSPVTGYFIDPAGGSDAAAGTSAATAWKTCEKPNSVAMSGILYIKAGTGSDCTTTNGLNASWSSGEIHPYYLDGSTPFKGLNGLARPVIRSTSAGNNPLNVSGANFVIGEIATDWDSMNITPRDWDIDITGDGVTIDAAHGNGWNDSDEATTKFLAFAGFNRGWVRINADNVTVQNYQARAYSEQSIRVQDGAQQWRILDGVVTENYGDAIRVNTDGATPHFGVIAGNDLSCGRVGDCVQTNNSTFDQNDPPDNMAITIRNNRMRGADPGGTNEQAVDLKGGKNIWVFENIVYGSSGDNNGQDQSDGNDRNTCCGIMRGNPSGERQRFAFNVVYDNRSGIGNQSSTWVWNNTTVYNNRDYTGAGSTLPDGAEHYLGISGLGDGTYVLNNISANNRSAEISWNTANTPDRVNGNVYWKSDGTPQWHDDTFGVDTKTSSLATWQGWLSGEGVTDADDDSTVGDPALPAGLTPTGDLAISSFIPGSGSAALNFAVEVATAASTTSGTTLTVGNDESCFFYSANGYTGESGWYIKIGNTSPVLVTDTDCDDSTTPGSMNTITIASSRSWNSGDSVWRVTSGGTIYDDAGAIDADVGAFSVPAP